MHRVVFVKFTNSDRLVSRWTQNQLLFLSGNKNIFIEFWGFLHSSPTLYWVILPK